MSRKFKAVFEECGEGLFGDFDPADPEDDEFLRIDLFAVEDGIESPLTDGSYCTCVAVGTFRG